MDVMEWLLLVCGNLAVASLVCSTVALGCSKLTGNLPLRHAMLYSGVIFCLVLPALIPVMAGMGFGIFSFDLPANTTTSSGPERSAEELVPPSEQVVVTEGLRTRALPPDSPSINTSSPSVAERKPAFHRRDGMPTVRTPKRHYETVVAPTETHFSVRTSRQAKVGVFLLPRLLGLSALTIWICGVLVFGWIRLRQLLLSKRFLKSCLPSHDFRVDAVVSHLTDKLELRHKPGVKQCFHLDAPAVLGFRKPVIVLPRLDDISNSELEAILWHEFAHLKRRDQRTQLLLMLSLVLYWWNPVLHRLGILLASIREMICDDVVIRSQTDPLSYAKLLLKFCERSSGARGLPPSMALEMSAAGDMEERLKRIVDRTGSNAPPHLDSSGKMLAFCVVVLAFASLSFAMVRVSATEPSFSRTVSTSRSDEVAGAQTIKDTSSAQPETRAVAGWTRLSVQDLASQLPVSGAIPEFGNPIWEPHVISGCVVGAAGTPVAHAKLQLNQRSDGQDNYSELTADETGRFRFVWHANTSFLSVCRMLCSNPTGSEMALSASIGELLDSEAEISIQLEPIVTRHIQVVDTENKPVAHAKVAAEIGPLFWKLLETDPEGDVSFRMPESGLLQSVAAYKDDLGLDYKNYGIGDRQRRSVAAQPTQFPDDGNETLRLTGSKLLTVSVVDQTGLPISGVTVSPWLLAKYDQSDYLNLSGLQLSQTTSSDGKVSFPWFPKWQAETITIWANKSGYDHPRGFYSPKLDDGQTTIQLQKLLPIRGRVTNGVGEPIEGLTVRFSGQLSHEQSTDTVTKPDGTYELLARPEGDYIVGVVDHTWGAKPKVVHTKVAELPLEDCDFQVQATTVVRIKVFNIHSGKPVDANRRQLVLQCEPEDQVPPALSLPKQLRVPSMTLYPGTEQDNGSIEYRLGPGDYGFRPNDHDEVQRFSVTGEDLLELEFQTKTGAMTRLTGRLVNKGRAVTGARVMVTGVRFVGDQWSTTTDDKGHFAIPIREEPFLLKAASEDRKLVLRQQISGSSEFQDWEMTQSAELTGRLVDRNGSPLAHTLLELRSRSLSRGPWDTVSTDEQGRFHVSGLVPQSRFALYLIQPASAKSKYRQDRHVSVADVLLEPGEHRDLGDVQERR